MPDEVRLWQIGSDNSLREIERAALDLETRLREWLARDISVLDPDCLAPWALFQLHTLPLPATHVEPPTGLHTTQDSVLESLTECDFR